MEKNENFKSELETQYTLLIEAQERKEKIIHIFIFALIILTLISVIISTVFSIRAFIATTNMKKKVENESEEERVLRRKYERRNIKKSA